MSRRLFLRFLKESRASAGAEMALVLPIVFALIFTTFEGGNYMWTEHKALKGVRDGARYAARLPFAYFTCPPANTVGTLTGPAGGGVPVSTREAEIKNLTRTGIVAAGGTPKISGWGDQDNDVVIEVTCNATYTGGLYTKVPGGAPVVTVRTADSGLPYPSILGLLGLDTSDMVVRARASAAVTGL